MMCWSMWWEFKPVCVSAASAVSLPGMTVVYRWSKWGIFPRGLWVLFSLQACTYTKDLLFPTWLFVQSLCPWLASRWPFAIAREGFSPFPLHMKTKSLRLTSLVHVECFWGPQSLLSIFVLTIQSKSDSLKYISDSRDLCVSLKPISFVSFSFSHLLRTWTWKSTDLLLWTGHL